MIVSFVSYCFCNSCIHGTICPISVGFLPKSLNNIPIETGNKNHMPSFRLVFAYLMPSILPPFITEENRKLHFFYFAYLMPSIYLLRISN